MRTHLFRTGVQLTLAVLFAAALSAKAQMPGAGPPGGMNAAIAKLFGDIKGFTGKAEVQILDSSEKATITMPMDWEFLDGKIRIELDMAQMKNSNMPPGAVDQLKQMGMARVISIVRPDKNLAYVAYPDSKMMMNMPLPKEDNASAKDSKVQKSPLGKETLDGHPCVKNKVVLSDGKESVEATTWNASDLKDFPLKIQTKEKENSSVVHFTKVQLTSPEAKDFEPPAGYTQYNSPQEMMQAMMSKMQPPAAQPEKK